jgi:hypothetical protein
MRGTAVVARKDIMLTDINKLPTGRVIAVENKGPFIVNIYASLGTARRTEREYIYNVELPHLLQAAQGDLIQGADFNCVTEPTETTGNFHNSRALSEMIRGLHLIDTWSEHPTRPAYTHYPFTGASRIDRI